MKQLKNHMKPTRPEYHVIILKERRTVDMLDVSALLFTHLCIKLATIGAKLTLTMGSIQFSLSLT